MFYSKEGGHFVATLELAKHTLQEHRNVYLFILRVT